MSEEKFCPKCEDYRRTKVENRQETYEVRRRKITVPVEATVCVTCGQSIGTDEDDQRILDAVYAEFRRQEDLLTPQRIAEIRKRYRLSQKSFAALLGMSEATINRYEQGSLQDPAHDAAIRACENPEFMRGLLQRRGQSLSDWQRKRTEAALAGHPDSAEGLLEHLGEVDWICMPREVTIQTGYRRFEYSRFAAVAVWFCDQLGSVSRTVINKLLFYADFLCFKTQTVSLTGAGYRKLDHGPVPADYGGLLARMESEDVLVSEEVAYGKKFNGTSYRAGPKAKTIVAEFSPVEMAVLRLVASTFKGYTATRISRQSHREAAYTETPEKELISYETAMKLSLSLPQ